MKNRISLGAVRKANDKMNGRIIEKRSIGGGIIVTVKTGKLNKSYPISDSMIVNAYKTAKSK